MIDARAGTSHLTSHLLSPISHLLSPIAHGDPDPLPQLVAADPIGHCVCSVSLPIAPIIAPGGKISIALPEGRPPAARREELWLFGETQELADEWRQCTLETNKRKPRLKINDRALRARRFN